MNTEIITEIRAMRREIKAIHRLLDAQMPDEWVTEKVAAELLGVSIRSLRKLRYQNKVGKWRCRETGRGVQYLKSELSKLFQTT